MGRRRSRRKRRVVTLDGEPKHVAKDLAKESRDPASTGAKFPRQIDPGSGVLRRCHTTTDKGEDWDEPDGKKRSLNHDAEWANYAIIDLHSLHRQVVVSFVVHVPFNHGGLRIQQSDVVLKRTEVSGHKSMRVCVRTQSAIIILFTQ